MFILCVPIQLFLHIYFSNAIKNNSFNGIAGFDDKIEYNICGVKKLLIQIEIHIEILFTVYIVLFCVINGMGFKMQWFNGNLIVLYLLSFITSIEMNNYKMIDQIYRKEDDRKLEIKGIENNTLPAMKICGLLLLGIMSVTIGFFIENNKIKKWNPTNEGYRTTKIGIGSLSVCVVLYGLICMV